MKYPLGKRSIDNLGTCDTRLIRIAYILADMFNFSVIWGHRNEEDQGTAFSKGMSEKQWPHSFHNSYPSKAFDIVPWPEGYQDRELLCYQAGLVLGIAKSRAIPIRWGGDWNRNGRIRDERFQDLAHFEIYLD